MVKKRVAERLSGRFCKSAAAITAQVFSIWEEKRMQPDRGTRAVVNLDAIVNNIKVARKNLKPETKLCAVVKANAYGHGAIPVAVTCMEAGADYFAVALVQ